MEGRRHRTSPESALHCRRAPPSARVPQASRLVVTLTPFYARLKEIQRDTSVSRIVATSIKEYLPPLLRVLFTLFKEKKGGHRIAARRLAISGFRIVLQHTPSAQHAAGAGTDTGRSGDHADERRHDRNAESRRRAASLLWSRPACSWRRGCSRRKTRAPTSRSCLCPCSTCTRASASRAIRSSAARLWHSCRTRATSTIC